MNKKILITTLGLGLVLTLSACGQKNEKCTESEGAGPYPVLFQT